MHCSLQLHPSRGAPRNSQVEALCLKYSSHHFCLDHGKSIASEVSVRYSVLWENRCQSACKREEISISYEFFFCLIVPGFVWLEFSPHLVVCTRASCSQLQSSLPLSLTVLVAGSCSSFEHSLHHKGLSWKGRTYII